ncbi:unnamed protein product [Microthlaspi erraticum]|uniref:MULE transposase domain-containing protein n=1 Tax=Microthlaspi erraticum TaxID=1685480 RepID=A0A6D2HW34_9BRAS|nr:unnamed protein product [Microthlaspi erraticum]
MTISEIECCAAMFPNSESLKLNAVGEEEAAVRDDNIVVLAGTWVRLEDGVFEFKLDMSRMCRSIYCRKTDGIDALRSKVSAEYAIDCRVVSVDLTYLIDDVLAEKYGNGSQPTEIVSTRDYRSFLFLHKADKSLNLFVMFRETVGDELVIMKPKPRLRAGLSLGALSSGVEDDVDQTARNGVDGDLGRNSIIEESDDEEFLRAVDALEASVLEAKSTSGVEASALEAKSASGQSEEPEVGIDFDDVPDYEEEYEYDEEGCVGSEDDVPDTEEGDYYYDDGEYDYDWWTEYVRNDGKGDAPVKYKGVVGSDDDDDFVEDLSDVRSFRNGRSYFDGCADPLPRCRENWTCVDDEDFCEHPPMRKKSVETRRADGGGDFVMETPPKPREYPGNVFRKRDDSYYGDDFIDPPSAPESGVELGPRNLMKGIRLTEIYGYEDVEPMFNDMDNQSSLTIHDLDLSYEDTDIFIDRLFRHKQHFKTTLAIYALKNIFRFRYHKHAHNYTVARCISNKCGWRIMAKQVGDSQTYEVRKAQLNHVCDVDSRGSYTKHASSKVIAALVRLKYKSCVGPRAKDLPASVLKEHGIFASYWKCWKARELAIADAHGTEEASYRLLPKYMYLLKYANPDSLCHLHTEVDKKGDRRFKYAFVALKTCIDGWKHLRIVVVVDGTHMFGKYRGAILTASGQDANFQIFPIAFAVVDSENDESWLWFFEKLLDIISDGADLAMISDRAPSIATAKEVHYPLAHHGNCLLHIQRNVNQKFTKRKQRYIVGVAGEAYTKAKFKRVYDLLKETDMKCWKYMELIDVRLWTRAYFEGDRYNLMSSNIAESLKKDVVWDFPWNILQAPIQRRGNTRSKP